jgi:hypothetical protein
MGSMRGETEMCTKFWLEGLKRRDHLKDLGIDGRTISKYILGKWDGRVHTGLIQLKIRAGDGLL